MRRRILGLVTAATLTPCAGAGDIAGPDVAPEPIAGGDLDAPAARPFYLATTTFLLGDHDLSAGLHAGSHWQLLRLY